MSSNRKELLKRIPSVEKAISILEERLPDLTLPHAVVVAVIREVLSSIREEISAGSMNPDEIEESAFMRSERAVRTFEHERLREVINATGIVIHTNLGRAPLDDRSRKRVEDVLGRYCNLEMELAGGRRTSRYRRVEFLLKVLTSAEGAYVVNNNAAAVMLVLNTIAKDKEVIVSRGQLVEIGGSFRLPDVMASSGARLREVGTTNRTNVDDYARAITSSTGAIMAVHLSNFEMSGYVQSVDVSELALLAKRSNIPVVYDLGSGATERIEIPGSEPEPSIGDALRTGASLVTFSGDKLLGGPQAGVILGEGELVQKMKKNPVSRALRLDKTALAALEGTMETYLEGSADRIPVLSMLNTGRDRIDESAAKISKAISLALSGEARIEVREDRSEAGGGSLPGMPFVTSVVSITPEAISAEELVARLRTFEPPVVARVKQGRVLLDPRTIMEDQIETCIKAVIECLAHP